MMKIVLIGGTSLLGRKLFYSTPRLYHVIPSHFQHPLNPTSVELDITKINQVIKLVKSTRPNIIIHASSIGDVDYCENHQKEAWRVNVEGTQNIIKAAQLVDARCVFFSSNAVFDGKAAPYDEQSTTTPINFYGQTKVAAEKIVTNYFPKATIFRLTTMYGWNDSRERQNPASWLIERLEKKLITPVVTDIFNNHLWVGQAAQAVWKAIEKSEWGHVFHIAGKNCLSRYDFAVELADVFKLNKQLLKPVTSDYFSRLTPRASNTCFSTHKMKRVLGIVPLSLKKGLEIMKKESK